MPRHGKNFLFGIFRLQCALIRSCYKDVFKYLIKYPNRGGRGVDGGLQLGRAHLRLPAISSQTGNNQTSSQIRCTSGNKREREWVQEEEGGRRRETRSWRVGKTTKISTRQQWLKLDTPPPLAMHPAVAPLRGKFSVMALFTRINCCILWRAIKTEQAQYRWPENA